MPQTDSLPVPKGNTLEPTLLDRTVQGRQSHGVAFQGPLKDVLAGGPTLLFFLRHLG